MSGFELTSTYRLQMNAGFTFEHARQRVDYFARLGVSHLYLSPILTARRGSTHGYDVVDPTKINPELGGESGLQALSDELHERDMGLIVDIVPNHMGIGDQNPYWDDLLAHGERSRFARWFDIVWDAPNGERHKVVLPVLGDDLARVLERGELSVELREGETPRVRYQSNTFPLDPSALPPDLQLAQVDPEEAGEIAYQYSGAAAREKLAALLDNQHYRLVHWRCAPDEINYRRFFDLVDLAAIRVEDPTVFDETHALTLRLVREGVIDGLRVDHVDGLLDPHAYLQRLRTCTTPSTPIVVEKILAPGESLPAVWPVEGTTGYDFLNAVDSVLHEPAGVAAIESFYRRLRRMGPTSFPDIVRNGKTAVLEGPLRADVARLAKLLAGLAGDEQKDWTETELRAALVSFIAALPVYRTYVEDDTPVTDHDRRAIEQAATTAVATGTQPAIVAFICDLLIGSFTRAANHPDRLEFARRLQQISAPAAAKGLEDNALYVYVPLISRNEIGGGPDQPLENAIERLHSANERRGKQWPRGLLATNTHDTKRSADVRSRVSALTESPAEWERAIRRWRRLNARHRRAVRGRMALDTNTEYLIYQTLLALWPPPRPGRRADDLPERAWRTSTRERLVRFAIKAAREAKFRTSWIDPDPEYEQAVTDFVSAILEPADEAPFLADVARLVARVAPIGARNAIARIGVHLTSPGTPDVYQGDELWNFTLVDPDNRRAVDFDLRGSALDDLEGFDACYLPDSVVDVFDSRVKLLVVQRLLHLRRICAPLFTRGGYERLSVVGEQADHVIAFARTHGETRGITIAARFAGESASQSLWWRNTAVKLPLNFEAATWRSQILPGQISSNGGVLPVSELLDKLPVAVLVN